MSLNPDGSENKIKLISDTMTGFYSVMRNLQEDYATYHQNYSEEALALLSKSTDFIEAVDTIKALGSIDRIDDDGINKLFLLSQQIAELYHLKKNGSRNLKESKIDLLEEKLTKAIKSYANIAQKIKSGIAGSSLKKALNFVIENDSLISETAKKYNIEKEFIQSVLFQELRFYAVDDPISDSFVIQSQVYDENLDRYMNHKCLFPPKPIFGYRNDSSTGPGQIFAETAIKAINSFEGKKIYDKDSKTDMKYIWNRLHSEKEFNIDMVGAVLALKKKELQERAFQRQEEKYHTIFDYSRHNLLKVYNGFNDIAEKYATVTEKYYKAFEEYNGH